MKPYKPRFCIRTLNRSRDKARWEALTGDFSSAKAAVNHFKEYLSTKYYLDQYDMGLFVKDSKEITRMLARL